MCVSSILRSTRRLAPLVALSLFLVASATASAEPAAQAYTLKMKISPGEKWTFDVTTAMKQKGKVTANGQVANNIDQAFEQRRKGMIDVLTVEGGMPTSMRVTFDAESANTGQAGAQQVPPFALAGKTVTLRKENGAVVTDLPEQPDPQTLSELSNMLQPDLSIYPKEPVSVNSEWNGDAAAMAKSFQLGPDDKVQIKCKLMAISQLDGRQVADVGITGSVLKHEQGFVEIRTTLGGVSRIDLLTGQALTGEIVGKIISRGANKIAQADGSQVDIAVDAEGELQVRQFVKIASGGGAAPAENGGFNIPLPPPADNPQPRNGMGPFAGSYKGDQVELELASTPAGYTGALMAGGKKYPVAAKSDGAKLTGSFESDGSKFELTATLDAGTLTLTSEGNTYTLKKSGGNPLSPPKPKNPLGQ